MSTSVASVLAFLLLVATPLDDPISVDAPDGVSVLKAAWQKVTFRPGWDEPQDPASNVGLQDARGTLPRDNAVNTTGTNQPLPTTGRALERREQRKNTRTSDGNEGSSPLDGPSPRVEHYLYQIKVLNSGSKTIEAIDWEYSIGGIVNPSLNRFQTFRRIKTANTSTLTGKSFGPPNRVVNARSGQTADSNARVVIRCILYSDGTVSWRGAANEHDCDVIRSHRKSRR